MLGCLLLSVPACETDPLEVAADAVEITADGTSFYLQPDGTPARIPLAVENIGDEPVYIARCGERMSLLIDRWRGDGWERFAGGVCAAVHSSVPVELEPGRIRWDTVAVADIGRYRVRVGLFLSPTAGTHADASSDPVDVLMPDDGPTTQASPSRRP